ncbi:hypothetical protein V2J09_018552 [Rumex salicifolius]
MDQRLFNAARLGDLNQLNEILMEDPSALENFTPLPSRETFLHIATLAGKTKFVKQITRLNPSFAHETNKEGLTPLHIASARGCATIVKELLKVSPDLSLAKDDEMRTPLHYAAMKGRVHVIKELLAKCPDSAKEVTDKCETAFHLAVKNSQFGALKALLEAIDGEVAAELLNVIDEEGQTDEEKSNLIHQFNLPQKEEEKAEDEDEIVVERVEDEELGAVGVVFKNISRGLDERALFVASLLAGVTYSTGLSPPENLWAINMKLDLRCLKHRMYVSKSHDPVDACPSKLYLVFIAFNTAGFISALLISFLYRGTRYARVMLASALCCLVLSYLVLTASLTPNFFGVGVIFATTLASFIVVLVFVQCLKNIIKRVIRFVIRSLGKLHLI